MAPPRIATSEGMLAWDRWLQSQTNPSEQSAVSRADLATAVRYTLQVIAEKVPGASVEVRVAPFGATQVIEGSNHRRGTPPAVIEMAPQTWLRIASGLQTWHEAMMSALIDASGEHADLSPHLPLRVSGPGS